MVIYELEYEEGNPSNFQDRYIVAPSFDAYKRCLFGEVEHNPNIGFFGRNKNYDIIEDNDDVLKLRFTYPDYPLPIDFIHEARVTNESVVVLDILPHVRSI